jgi:predicted nuclease of predicted toxin-antitoxin system
MVRCTIFARHRRLDTRQLPGDGIGVARSRDAEDAEIFTAAKRESAVVMTKDSDF